MAHVSTNFLKMASRSYSAGQIKGRLLVEGSFVRRQMEAESALSGVLSNVMRNLP